MHLGRLVVVTASALAASACQGPPAEPEPVPAAPPAVAWKDMTHAERADYMKRVVLPTMKPLFAAWEPDDFARMTCAACHGADAKEREFKMPNPDLPKLPADAAGFRLLAAQEPQAVKFMSETVVPRMAALLGEAPYDHATHQGFGCFRCHTAEK
jgi:hypothetical protein